MTTATVFWNAALAGAGRLADAAIVAVVFGCAAVAAFCFALAWRGVREATGWDR